MTGNDLGSVGSGPPQEGPRVVFREVQDDGLVEGLFDGRDSDPAVLFLHDPWCPISRRAYAEVEEVDATVLLLDVSAQRRLSKVVEEQTGVRHESPQLFVLVGGKPDWHASHGRITADAVETAISAALDASSVGG